MMLTRMKPTVKFCIRFLYSGLGIAATVYFIREVSLIINVHDNYHFINVINGDFHCGGRWSFVFLYWASPLVFVTAAGGEVQLREYLNTDWGRYFPEIWFRFLADWDCHIDQAQFKWKYQPALFYYKCKTWTQCKNWTLWWRWASQKKSSILQWLSAEDQSKFNLILRGWRFTIFSSSTDVMTPLANKQPTPPNGYLPSHVPGEVG